MTPFKSTLRCLNSAGGLRLLPSFRQKILFLIVFLIILASALMGFDPNESEHMLEALEALEQSAETGEVPDSLLQEEPEEDEGMGNGLVYAVLVIFFLLSAVSQEFFFSKKTQTVQLRYLFFYIPVYSKSVASYEEVEEIVVSVISLYKRANNGRSGFASQLRPANVIYRLHLRGERLNQFLTDSTNYEELLIMAQAIQEQTDSYIRREER